MDWPIWARFRLQGDDLSLELGLSVWLCESEAALDEAIEAMYQVRSRLLDVADMDATTEPVPFVGRSSETDLVSLGAYLDHLLIRAAQTAGCDRRVLARRVAATFEPTEAVSSLAC